MAQSQLHLLHLPEEQKPELPPENAEHDLAPPPVSSTIPVQFDWSSWYLTDEDDMGENPVHAQIIHDFVDLLLNVAHERGWHRDQVGSDAFFAWVPAHPLVRISPDLYLLDSQVEPLPASFQMWKPGHVPPLFALEVVSEDWRKDYDENPKKYAQLGAKELVIFDPDAAGESRAARGQRVPLQVFRRNSEGFLCRVYAGPGPVWSETLGLLFFIANLGQGRDVRLRFAYDREGRNWVKSSAEVKADAERAKADAEQARAEAEQAKARAEEESALAKAQRELAEKNQAIAKQQRDIAFRERDLAKQTRDEEARARKAAEARVQELLAELSKLKSQ